MLYAADDDDISSTGGGSGIAVVDGPAGFRAPPAMRADFAALSRQVQDLAAENEHLGCELSAANSASDVALEGLRRADEQLRALRRQAKAN